MNGSHSPVEVTEDCVGTGQCVLVAPNVLELGDDGRAQVVARPLDADDLAEARSAADVCPMGAIRVVQPAEK